MIINARALMAAAPLKDMFAEKQRAHGVSFGLGEAGYDIRIKQSIEFIPNGEKFSIYVDGVKAKHNSTFIIASAIEEFDMPDYLVGVVHDKSTWARKGLSVFNTVIEPGFKGGLTLELVYKGDDHLFLSAGAGIAQVLFTKISEPAVYTGKYQNQSMEPVEAIFEK